MTDRTGIFAGDDPMVLAQEWLHHAEASETSDPNAMALASVDALGMPNVRIVLLKAIEAAGFVFFTNYESRKAAEIEAAGFVAANLHWKSLGRQLRIRGSVARVTAAESDAYYVTRPLGSRIGAWASDQSRPLASRAALIDRVAQMTARLGGDPARPPHWGGYRIAPLEIEFWANGESRLHDRFRWSRHTLNVEWLVTRLNP